RVAADPRLLLDPDELLGEAEDSGRIAARVSRLAAELELRPAVLIRYRRRAFVAPRERRLRITFDEVVQAFAPDDGRLEGSARPLLPTGWVVLEVKFDQRMPSWTRSALISLGLRLQPFSKYAEGMLALRGAASHALSPSEARLRSPAGEEALDLGEAAAATEGA
ncbi:MAG TPA: hypothetical protein DEA08_12520, partial [Planctomycetes bacterium]|nr:hypothetical protein [Planctomycetota bacterium]